MSMRCYYDKSLHHARGEARGSGSRLGTDDKQEKKVKREGGFHLGSHIGACHQTILGQSSFGLMAKAHSEELSF